MVEQSRINRRTVLLGMAAATVGNALLGCRPTTAKTLEISLLAGSMPAEVLKKFRQQATEPVRFQTLNQLSSLFQQLQRWQSKQTSGSSRNFFPWASNPQQFQPDNLASLDDYWLASAIAQNLIDPLQLEPDALEKLPADWLQNWQQFVDRAVKSSGNQAAAKKSAKTAKNSIWAAPYRVQSLAIVYRQGKVSGPANREPFSSWRELLDPALQNRIAMPEHPRLVLGLLQKIRSGSFNPVIESNTVSGTEASLTVTDIEQQLDNQLGELLVQLNRQVKTYDGENSLRALINGDVDVAVSWSADIVAAQRRYQDLRMAIPTEGSLLSTDIWVRPKGAAMSESAKDWIRYCWESGPAVQLSLAGKGLSPVFLGKETALPEVLSDNLLSSKVIRESEPLLPLSAAAQEAYFNFWQRPRADR